MTFRGKPAGNVLLYSVVIMIVGTTLVLQLVRNTVQHSRLAKRSEKESDLIMTAQAIGNLFKEELYNNYQTYANKNDHSWDVCRAPEQVSPSDFLNILQTQRAACATKNLTFSFFTPSTLAMTAFKNGPLTLVQPINSLAATVTITDFNADSARNTIIGNVFLGPEGTSVSMSARRAIRINVDISRTVSSPAYSKVCRICRTVAGAVCCGGSYLYTYLSSTGDVVWGKYDLAQPISTKNPIEFVEPTNGCHPTTNPRAIAVKNCPTVPERSAAFQPTFPAASIQYYESNSYCVAAGGGNPIQPIPWIIDAVQGPDCAPNYDAIDKSKWVTYYLTTHGYLFRTDSAGSQSYAAGHSGDWPTPGDVTAALDSIAYDEVTGMFSLLTPSKTVLTTKNLCDPTSWQPVGDLVLNSAAALAFGVGPCPATAPASPKCGIMGGSPACNAGGPHCTISGTPTCDAGEAPTCPSATASPECSTPQCPYPNKVPVDPTNSGTC